jgi:hypothetical protein
MMTMVSFPGSHRNPPSTSATSQHPHPSSLPLPLPAHLTTLPVRLRQRTDIVPQQTSAQTCRNRTACMREHMVQVLPSPHTHTHSLSYLPRTLDDLHRTAPHQTNPDPLLMSDTHTHIYIYTRSAMQCSQSDWHQQHLNKRRKFTHKPPS